jgi:hypothetical protein
MGREITVVQFIQAIKCLPSDKPITDPRKWYKTQKEHWIGWLSENVTSRIVKGEGNENN